MKRTMHVFLTLPIEVLDLSLSKEDVTRLVSQWVEAGITTLISSTPLCLTRGSCVCTVFAVKEEKDD